MKYKKLTISVWFIASLLSMYEFYIYRIGNIGFSPIQSYSFSHKLHSDKIGIKCLYCHNNAEKSPYSNIPTTYVCITCHIGVKSDSKLLTKVMENYDQNIPLTWKSVYRLPDYAHFNHSRHIRAMIDCASCHAYVETMDSMRQEKALTMQWCLDCHRNPKDFVIPARSISGIFTNDLYNDAQKNSYKVIKEQSMTIPYFGMYSRQRSIPYYENIFSPHFPQNGSENCSSCHY
jgi:hypothetical protein